MKTHERKITSMKKSLPSRTTRGTVSALQRLKDFDVMQLHAVLATESGGQPYTSMLAYALTPDCRGIVFTTPKSTRKYRNIVHNSRVSLLIDTRSNTQKDYLSAEAITVLGDAHPVRRGPRWNELSNLLIRKHPKLAGIMDDPETKIILIEIRHCIHISRFQTVSEWKME
jgi:general stress protein 26